MEEVTIGRLIFTMSELSFLGVISAADKSLEEDEWSEMLAVVAKFECNDGSLASMASVCENIAWLFVVETEGVLYCERLCSGLSVDFRC